MRGVPNPATPRQLRPAALISDRAKRYRANATPPPGARRCGFCGSARNIDIDHIDGEEAHGDVSNLMYLCRTCNTKKGIVQKGAGIGRRTVQRNPAKAPTFRQYVDAVLILRGDVPGNVAKATRIVQAASPARRAEFAGRIGQARNPEPASPTYKQYAYAVSIHRRGQHDEGGAIIHATPPALRSKYARQFAESKRRKSNEVPF